MFGWFKKKSTDNEGAGGNGSPLQRLRERLAKTRESFFARFDAIFAGKKAIDAELLEELEELLITADLGFSITRQVVDRAKMMVDREELNDPRALKAVIKENLLGYLTESEKNRVPALPAEGPLVIMVVGVNGVGKTTTIGKLSHRFSQEGKKVLLVAADTFRAAAAEQLKTWGERIGVEVRASGRDADPSSVVYDGLDYATGKGFDVIIIDTAGRLHTKVNLMEELKKIKRVAGKKLPGAPHEVFLVLDATTGQNAISQARLFNEAVELSGLILTKLDGTAKGGIVVNICHAFNIPVRFIGIGEKMDDLRPFDPREFVAALFLDEETSRE